VSITCRSCGHVAELAAIHLRERFPRDAFARATLGTSRQTRQQQSQLIGGIDQHALSSYLVGDDEGHGASIPCLQVRAQEITIKAVLDASNDHDLYRIMSFFSEDCVLEMPRGPDAWGSWSVGAAAVREALRSRFTGIPDVN
jgi:hypothetical protein